MKYLAALFLSLLSFFAVADEPQLSPNAPEDKPIAVTQEERKSLEAAIAPYIAKAKSTYPDAKARFIAGLPLRLILSLSNRLLLL